MGNFNKVMLMGNLTRDPESRNTTNGNVVANFGLAVNRRFTVNGEQREETTFVDVEAWGKQAELLTKHLTKGSPIFLEGRLKLDSWETDGQKHSKLRVVLENFQFMGNDTNSTEKSEKVNTGAKPEDTSSGASTDIF